MATKDAQTCKLCQTKKPLCHSHIIPEFMYKPVYSDNHKFKGIRPDGSDSKLQKGLREYLLCADCEGKINKYETYSSAFLRSVAEGNMSGEVLTYNNIDYKKFKLFLLSIIWKSSISTVPIFNAINLGPHEKIIHQMLISEDPGKEEDYPCMIYFFKDEDNLTRSIHAPEEIRLEGHRSFRFLITRFLFIYFISNHQKPIMAHEMALKENGNLHFMLLNDIDYKAMPEYIRATNILTRRKMRALES